VSEKPPPKNTQFKIVWDDSNANSLYANVAQVKATREEFMLLFGTSPTQHPAQSELSAMLTKRIVLSPVTAKRLALVLSKGLREYESRFGALDGEVITYERLMPTPALRPAHFASAKGNEKANLLFQFLEKEKIRPAFERSCEFLARKMLGNRFLLGFEKNMIGQNPDEKILDICERMEMPENFLESFRGSLPEANIVGFGFGEDEGTCTVKAYLEFGIRFYRAIKNNPRNPDPYLSHLGFKWDAEDNRRKALTRYTCFPGYTTEGILKRLSEDFYGDKAHSAFEIVKAILDLASNRVNRERFLYLDVKEENNPRSSFDINVYRANLRLEAVYPFLLGMCQHYSISEEQFRDLFEPRKTHVLGHLAGGVDGQGRDFLTIYFGE
jgi:hypothetical protein